MAPYNINNISIQICFSFFLIVGGLSSSSTSDLNAFGCFALFLFFSIIFYCLKYIGGRVHIAIQAKSLLYLNFIDPIIILFIPALFYLFFEYSFIDFNSKNIYTLKPIWKYIFFAANNELGFWNQYFTYFGSLSIAIIAGTYINKHLHDIKNNTNGDYDKIILKTIITWFFFFSMYIYKILIEFQKVDLVFYLIFSGFQLGLFYWIIKIFIPRNKYRFDRKYFLLIALSFLVTVIFILSYYQRDIKLTDILISIMFYYIIVHMHYSETNKLRELNKLNFDSIESKLDLQNLQTSLNPAFLLSSLQKIGYKSSQENAPHTASGINKLIAMMHHLLYVNKDDLVPIELEIIHLKNYLDFQMMRHSRNEYIDVVIDIDDSLSNIHVPPMVFLPFVENAFKYGISYNYPSKIAIKLYKLDNLIKFEIFNTKHGHLTSTKLISSNIGIENTQKRLALLLPEKHNLIIKEDEQTYIVNLDINIV